MIKALTDSPSSNPQLPAVDNGRDGLIANRFCVSSVTLSFDIGQTEDLAWRSLLIEKKNATTLISTSARALSVVDRIFLFNKHRSD